jgi:hypothetical protein
MREDDEFVGHEDSDDGYDAAKDAYLMGYGPPVTRSRRQEEEDLKEEYRRNGR